MYGINWSTFVVERVPSPLRKSKLLAFLHALLVPVKTLHSMFLIFRQTIERDVRITGQVRIMEYWLNELFDSSSRRFIIQDYTNVQPVLIWGDSFNNPLYLPTFLSSSAYDFQVIAPCALKGQKAQIKAFLDRYKLAGKRYKLIFKNANGSVCSDTGISFNNNTPTPN